MATISQDTRNDIMVAAACDDVKFIATILNNIGITEATFAELFSFNDLAYYVAHCHFEMVKLIYVCHPIHNTYCPTQVCALFAINNHKAEADDFMKWINSIDYIDCAGYIASLC
jgi:hypothetical protein